MTNIANLLTEHMAIWTAAESEKKSGRDRASGNAGTVYGVKKLRELILELAVRGKLVPQDQNDEPASELLKRIKAKKNKPLKLINQNSYELPKGWEWVHFGEIAQHNSGKTLDKGRNSGVLRDYITTSNLYWGKFELDSIKQMPIEQSELERCSARKNDLLICEGGEAGRAAVWIFDKEVCFQNHVHRARLYEGISPFYAYRYFEKLNATGEIEQYRKGVGISNMSGKALASVIFALPPLTEQHRIVAKVDELMALCHQLEQQHSNAQDAHETLVSQLLATLTQSQNAAEFNANWQRIYAHFDVLFTTEASIDALKQTLLQLAVMGKLVPQDPNDEPASELLKRIQAEKAKLIAEGKLKKEKPLAPIGEDEKPFNLPNGWEWASMDMLALNSEAGWSPQCLGTPRENDDWGVLKVSAVTWGEFKPEENKGLPSNLKPRPEYEVKAGDFLISRANTAELVAKAVVVPINAPSRLMLSDKIIRFVLAGFISSDFVNLVNNSTFSRNYYVKVAGGTSSSMKNVTREQIRNLVIGLPPLTEQHRIVAKVDALMTLCDQLKTCIQQANQQQQTIADALVAQALKPATAEVIDLAAYRVAVTCNIIKRMQHNPAFGRTFAMKLLYLSQQHIGFETHLEFEREAAGPFDQWIYDFEREGIAAGWFGRVEKQLSNGYTKIEYQVKSAIDEPVAIMNLVGCTEQRKELDRLFTLFADKKTEEAEIVATLFAAWNDFLLSQVSPTDEQIIQEVRENWHASKARFSPEQLTKWLSWLRDNNIVPTGKGCKTIKIGHQQKLIN